MRTGYPWCPNNKDSRHKLFESVACGNADNAATLATLNGRSIGGTSGRHLILAFIIKESILGAKHRTRKNVP